MKPGSLGGGWAYMYSVSSTGLGWRPKWFTISIIQVAYAHGETFCADSIGGMFGIYFSEKVPSSFAEVSASNRDRFNRFFHAMLDAGVYLAPSAYEAGFVSVTHDDVVIEATKVAIDKAFAAIK